MNRNLLVAPVLVACAVLLGGCFGGDTEVKQTTVSKGQELTDLKKAERKRSVETALDLVGLADRMDHRPKQLSGGQEQRVAIARAIVVDPDIILADEPTGNLDARSGEEIMSILTTLNEKLTKTIVMVTHDPHAAAFAKRQLHLEKGVLVENVGKVSGQD